MSKKHKKFSWLLFTLILSAINGYVLMFAFALLDGIPIGISSFALGLIICATTAAIKKIIQQLRKKGKRVNSTVSKT